MDNGFEIGVIVLNKFGVLHRLTGLFSRRFYNIDSLSVAETENPKYSRMTIAVRGDDRTKEQVIKQLNKCHDVIKVVDLEEKDSVFQEHMLVKILVNSKNKEITDFANKYGAKVLDFCENAITIELTGDKKLSDKFIAEAEKFDIIEFCRSGVVSLGRGEKHLLNIK